MKNQRFKNVVKWFIPVVLIVNIIPFKGSGQTFDDIGLINHPHYNSALSPNGEIVIAQVGTRRDIYLWQNGEGTIIVNSDSMRTANIFAVSNNKIVAGSRLPNISGGGTSPFLLQDDVYTELQLLPNSTGARITDITGDGSVILGYSQIAGAYVVTLWKDDEVINIGCPPNSDSCWGINISANGDVILAEGRQGASALFYLWKDDSWRLIEYPAGYDFFKHLALSSNGQVVVATAERWDVGTNRLRSLAFRWENGSYTLIDCGDDDSSNSIVRDVNADGSVMICQSDTSNPSHIWRQGAGLFKLTSLLSESGVSTEGWLLQAMNLSDDGHVVAGTGYITPYPGRFTIWRAVLAPVDEEAIVVNSTTDNPHDSSDLTNCDTGEMVEIDGEEVPECTLRAAIQTANARGGASIHFNIPGGGVPSIEVTEYKDTGGQFYEGLSTIETPIVIDGTTQPGGWVEVTQGSRDGTDYLITGITVGPQAGGSVIRGLVINGFGGYGILIEEGADGCMIEGNRVGTDAAGLRARPNGYTFMFSPDVVLRGGGVRVDSEVNKIRNNLLAGNWSDANNPGPCCGGVDLWLGPTANLNHVYRNHFGSDVNGDPILLHEPSPIEYMYLGLFLEGDGNVVGGSEADANVFHGTVMGLVIWGDDNEISHNRIGPSDPAGITPEVFPLNENGIGLGASTRGQKSANGTLILANTVTVANEALGIIGNGNTVRANNLTGQIHYGPRLDSKVNRNFQNTVKVRGSDNTLETNRISSNVWGINVHEGTGNRIERNTIEAGWGGIGFHRNVPPDQPAEALITANSITAPYFGIDFGDEAFVPNDVSDSDTGPNTLLNYPVVTQATWDGEVLSVEGFVQTPLLATATYTIELFGARECSSLPPQANGIHGDRIGATPLFASGEEYIGHVNVNASLGEAYFSIAVQAPASYPVITLTSSRHDRGVTSHFGRCVRPIAPAQTARAEVDPDETGQLLTDMGVSVSVGDGTAKQNSTTGNQHNGGTLFVTKYDNVPELVQFSNSSANSHSGNQVTPIAMAPRHWMLNKFGFESPEGAEPVQFEVCLDPKGHVDHADLPNIVLIKRNEESDGLWEPLNTVEQEINDILYLCANELNAFGDFGFGTADKNLFTSLDDDGETFTQIPTNFALGQNYPNPFNPGTVMPFDLPSAAHVRLAVFDMLGRRVSLLVDEYKSAGRHHVNFDGHNLSSGMYIYRLDAGDVSLTRKMMLVK